MFNIIKKKNYGFYSNKTYQVPYNLGNFYLRILI